jgi:hypothetical protein
MKLEKKWPIADGNIVDIPAAQEFICIFDE